MACKFCGSPLIIKVGFKAGTQYYKCKDCHRKFAGRDAPEGMRFSTATIGESLGLFYDGLSLADISRHLVVTEGIYVDPATVWRWVIRYSKQAHQVLDGMRAYPDAIEQVFGADSKHIVAKGLTANINTNIVEGFQGTVKERTKVMRGLKTMESAEIISEGFIVHYNFLRPHMTLNGKTPAMVAGLIVPFNTWIELVDYLGKKGRNT